MSQAKPNDLALLIDLIQSNGTKMLDVCSKAGQTYPSVYDAFDSKAEEIRRHPEIHNPTNVVLAAARQLVAMLEEPNVSIRQISFGVSVSRFDHLIGDGMYHATYSRADMCACACTRYASLRRAVILCPENVWTDRTPL
jgi:hypothetical protein